MHSRVLLALVVFTMGSFVTLSFIFNRMPHHGAFAGYDQLAKYVRRIPSRRLSPRTPKLVPSQAWYSLARRSGMPWYDERSLDLEAAAAIRLMFGKNEICHVLYGEDNF